MQCMAATPDVPQRRTHGGGRRALGTATVAGYRLLVRARDKAVSLLWAGAFAEFGPRSVLQLPVRLDGERRIAVGGGVFVGAGCWLQVLGEPDGPVAIEIGDGTSIVGDCVLSATESIRLGR